MSESAALARCRKLPAEAIIAYQDVPRRRQEAPIFRSVSSDTTYLCELRRQLLLRGRRQRSGLGSEFGSLVRYLKHGKEGGTPHPGRVAWVSYRNLDGINDPTLAARLMRAHAEESPRVERPVYHFGLSLSPAEHLEPAQWNAAVDRVLARMGLAEHQALVMAHGDTDREHVHVVVNRVHEDGRAWETRQDMVEV